MCLRYDFRNQNSARIGINLLPNVIKLFSDRTCIFHARSFLPLSGQRRPDDVLASLIAPHFDFLLLLRYLILLILIEIYAAGRNVSSCCHYISHSCCCCCSYCSCCCSCCHSCCCCKCFAYFRPVACINCVSSQVFHLPYFD